VLQALGLPSSGKVQIEPGDLEGKTALVEIRPSEYQNQAGDMVRRNEVPYDGYRAATDGDRAAEPTPAKAQRRAARDDAGPIDEHDIPF